MKANSIVLLLLAILLFTISVHAQSTADSYRKKGCKEISGYSTTNTAFRYRSISHHPITQQYDG